MSQKSLGLIETYGLLAGVEAADAAVKSANVELVGYELSKGSGMTTIKVEGDVGAVKAAIQAAQVAAEKVGKVAAVRVIARPAAGIEMLVRNGDTVGYQPPTPEPEPEPPAPPAGPDPTPEGPAGEGGDGSEENGPESDGGEGEPTPPAPNRAARRSSRKAAGRSAKKASGNA